MNNNTQSQFLISRRLTPKSVYVLQGLARDERARLKKQRKSFKVSEFAAKIAARFKLPLGSVERMFATI